MSNTLNQAISVQENQINTLNAQKVGLERSIIQTDSSIRSLQNQLNLASNPVTGSSQNTNLIREQISILQRQKQLASDNLNSTNVQLSEIQESYDINRSNLADPFNNTGLATAENSTPYPGTDPVVNRQSFTQSQSNTGFIPDDQLAAGTTTVFNTNNVVTTSTAQGTTTYFEPPLDQGGTTTYFGEPEPEGRTTYFGPPEIDPNIDPNTGERLETGTSTFFGDSETTESDVVAGSSNQGLTGPRTDATSGAVNQDQNNFITQQDWRIRLRLAPNANYLYKGQNPGILQPLSDTDGVVFPYMPNITINYAASYDATELVHSNYKVYQYKNSSVDSIQISGDFTAQDTKEANYLLAVIHFFRSVTKMFYGQDNFPKPGTPPPLCFLIGMGAFQFNDHPLAITNFTYSLPNNVDYIRAGNIQGLAGVNVQPQFRPTNIYDPGSLRLNGIMPGGMPPSTAWNMNSNNDLTVTYVPTQMQIQLQCIPMLSRNSISNVFSLEEYGNGNLLRGIQNVRGGIW
jgi:hypothetical protein